MTTGQIVLIATAALLLFWGVGAYNRLVSLRAAMAAAWSPIDAQLRRRQPPRPRARCGRQARHECKTPGALRDLHAQVL